LMLGLLLTGGAVVALVGSTAITVLIPNEERGTTLALLSVIERLVGLGLAPAVVALGIWFYGSEAYLAETIAIIGVVTGAISLAGFVIAMANAPQRQVEPATAE
jgi:hypothetical protein